MRPQFRITTRRLLLLIAVIAAGFGFWDRAKQNERFGYYRRRAADHEQMIRLCEQSIAEAHASGISDTDENGGPFGTLTPIRARRLIPHLTTMRDRYLYAADHPRGPLLPGLSLPE